MRGTWAGLSPSSFPVVVVVGKERWRGASSTPVASISTLLFRSKNVSFKGLCIHTTNEMNTTTSCYVVVSSSGPDGTNAQNGRNESEDYVQSIAV